MRAALRAHDLRAAQLVVAVLGAAYLALVAVTSSVLSDVPHFGSRIYDVYYLSLLDGRLDLPARTLRFEGHYTPDGTGYLYHGVAPLLTRFTFGWAWPLERLSMAGPSIWLWTVVGTVGWQVATIILAAKADLLQSRRWLVLALCGALWVAGPGPILVMNQSLYHEPIAIAFAMSGLFAAVWLAGAHGRLRPATAVLLLALFASVTVHARPNVAIGLYAGTVLAAGWWLWRARAAFLLPAAAAMVVLAIGGMSYLGLNALRFGEATTTHGSFSEADIRYGSVFWGVEEADSPRGEAFRDHGRFNVARILPNGAIYLLDVPVRGPLTGLSDRILERHTAATEPVVDFVRVENPRVGMFLIWPVWCLLALPGLLALRRAPAEAGLLLAFLVSGIVTAAYATVTLRYRIDLWPILALLAILGAVHVMRAVPAGRGASGPALLVVSSSVLVGALAVGVVAATYGATFRETDDSFYTLWPESTCLEWAREIPLTEAQAERTCRTPPLGDEHDH